MFALILFVTYYFTVKDGEKVTENDIQEFCKARMAEFKIPKVVFIADDFPRTATGKIQRRIVSAHFLGLKK